LTATASSQATDQIRIDDWQDVEVVVLNIANGATVVALQAQFAGDTPETWRTLQTFVASPESANALPVGLYTFRCAPHKFMRLIATTVAGSDTPFMSITG